MDINYHEYKMEYNESIFGRASYYLIFIRFYDIFY
jgi:hypothetical protein